VYTIVHLLTGIVGDGTSVQEEEAKSPPAPPSLHDTVPVGGLFVPVNLSVTATWNVIGPESAADDGFGVTAVVVICPDIVSADLPELVA